MFMLFLFVPSSFALFIFFFLFALVQAVHVDNTAGNLINREYMREYVLPNWVDVDNLRAKMSEDSTLTVEVPIPHDRVPAFNRQIKITQ